MTEQEDCVSEIWDGGIQQRIGMLRYRREELLDLRDACEHFQEEWWLQLHEKLGPEVAEELQELQELQAFPEGRSFRRRTKNSERRQRSKAKREALHVISVNSLEPVGDGPESNDENSQEGLPFLSFQRANENTVGRNHSKKGMRKHQESYDEDTEEKESFQPPAFAVEGEPDFESGPPQDGWEYLRRVKYEAARCPKVVVAKIDPAKLISEQTQYMPEMPEISDCSPDLLPSQEWEKEFLANFSLLRMALSNLYVPPMSASERVPSVRNKAAWELRCFGSITKMHEDGKGPQEKEHHEEEGATFSKDLVLPSPESIESTTDCVLTGFTVKTLVGTAADSQVDGSVTEVEDLSVPSYGSPGTGQSDWLTSVCNPEPANKKEMLVPAVELINSHPDPKLDQSVEANYVIDLSLLKPYIPHGELAELSCEVRSESEYLICGEPVDTQNDTDVGEPPCSLICIREPEDDEAPSAKFLGDAVCSNALELGYIQDSSSAVEIRIDNLTDREPDEGNGGNEDTKPASSHLTSFSLEGNQLPTANCNSTEPSGVSSHRVDHVEMESLGSKIEAEHLPRRWPQDGNNHIERRPSGVFVFEELEDHQLTTVDYTDLLGGCTRSLDHAEFEDICGDVEYPFECPTVGESEWPANAMIPSFSYPDSSEIDDLEADIPSNTNFMDSIVGLEIYRTGKILGDDGDESVDEYGHSKIFEIDGSLKQLCDKVFQLRGVLELPFMHLLLRLDEVSRAALFRYHVSWLDNVDGLPQDRALWLLALSVVVDTPLNAETCAAFRALLRCCAGIRSLKQRRDDVELYMLNVLITVAGLYFGQAESMLS